MRGGRLVVAGLSGAFVALAVAVSCGFPDPILLSLEGGASSGTSGSSGSVGDGGPEGSTPEDNDGGEEAGVDAARPCPSGDPCDCDGDGFQSRECGGNDCDDYDDRYKPDAGFRVEIPPDGGDWNCDDVITPEFPLGSSCAGKVPCSGAIFQGYPACGTADQYNACGPTASGGVCTATQSFQSLLRCR